METMSRLGRRFCAVLLVIFGLALPPASALGQAPSCAGCYPDGQPCTLEYGASGTVRDRATGLPIAGALVQVLDLTTMSADDGSYALKGSRAETCHLDYYWSLSVSADGYETAELAYYATDTLSENLDLLLDPLVPATGFTVEGTVAEFPACEGRMRGVAVTLEPLGLTTETSVGPDGGVFEFLDVPPGDYILRVSPACNPFGCWRLTALQVVRSYVQVGICMDERTPAVPPTPTQTRTPTVPFCPTRTPCALGQQPRKDGCTSDICGLSCGCESCPPCPTGEVLVPRFNFCQCVPDDGEDPTPTPTNCPVRTPCRVGEQPRPCDNACGLGCGCESCPPCDAGEVALDGPNFCRCDNPRETSTPTPTSTGTPCAAPTQLPCSAGQESVCTEGEECRFSCECTPCTPCPAGMEYAARSCTCVVALDGNGPAATDTGGSSSGGCAIDPHGSSGTAPLLLVPALLLAWRRRVVNPQPI